MCPQGELHGHNWSSASVNLGELSLLDSLHEHDMDTTTPPELIHFEHIRAEGKGVRS